MQHPHEVTPFFYNTQDNEVITVRTHIDSDGNIWFCAKDVCQVLEIVNYRDAISTLDDDEKLGVGITDVHLREQETSFVSESGLYALIFKSRKPEAKRFRRWVTSEVLPQIRKTGSYTVKPEARKPVPVKKSEVLKTVKKSTRGIPQGIMKGAEKILSRMGLDDFQITLALDDIFKQYTGTSVLEMTGIKAVKNVDFQEDNNEGTWSRKITWTWEHKYPKDSYESGLIYQDENGDTYFDYMY